MLDIQGWIVVQDHWLESEEDDCDLRAIGEEIRRRAAVIRGESTIVIDVQNYNATDKVLIAAGANRWRDEHDDLIAFVAWIGEVAPGSYGLIHAIDFVSPDERERDVYRCWVLKRGVLARGVEPRFTPFSVEVGE